MGIVEIRKYHIVQILLEYRSISRDRWYFLYICSNKLSNKIYIYIYYAYRIIYEEIYRILLTMNLIFERRIRVNITYNFNSFQIVFEWIDILSSFFIAKKQRKKFRVLVLGFLLTWTYTWMMYIRVLHTRSYTFITLYTYNIMGNYTLMKIACEFKVSKKLKIYTIYCIKCIRYLGCII